MYIREYISLISALYIQFNLNYHRKTLAFQCCENLRETGLWRWALLGTYIYEAQFIIASYNWAKFVSITLYRNSWNLALCVSDKMRLKNMIFVFLWGNLHFVKQIVKQYYISSIFSLWYCQIGKRLWWTVCCVQCHLFQANVLYVITFWINVFQPAPGAVYLGGVQRLMTHIIIIIEMVSISLDS